MTTPHLHTQQALDDLVRLTQTALGEVLRAAATEDGARAQRVLDSAPERRAALLRARMAVQDECRELWGTRQLPRLAGELDLAADLGRLNAQVDRLARQLTSGRGAAPALRPAS
jgi:hypothetical protein